MNALRALELGSELSERPGVSTPIRGIFVACCARAASGHADAPPRRLMNSRRRISVPKLRGQHCIGLNEYFDRAQIGQQNHCRTAHPMSLEGQKLRIRCSPAPGRYIRSSPVSGPRAAALPRLFLASTPDLESHRKRLREAFGNTMSDEFVDVLLGKLVETLRPGPFDELEEP